MFSSDQLDTLLKEAMIDFGGQNNEKSKSGSNKRNKKNSLAAAEALVIAGLLTGTLKVFSVLVDADQEVSILLRGSLKQKDQESQLDQIMAQIGKVPFDDLVASMIRRLK